NRALSTTEISNLYQATATVPDPVGWWKLDESSGTIASDSSGYANDATMGYYYCCTLPTWAPTGGKINGALQVSSASTNYVQTADTTSLQLSGSWTISGWINLTSLPPLNNYYTMVTRGVSGPSNYGLGVDNEFCAPGTVEWFLWNNDTGGGFPHVCYGGTINANTWYFIAGTYDSTTLTQTLYVNGTAVANGTQSLPPYSSAGTGVSIGYDDCCNGGFANATIDDVRVYNRVLSAAEISALYASPSGGSCP
ncbi:MAG TPA: LamG-like jellyroll fold domain-containing protein, partial [Patescibacteria group bacterium]|nr:LamG-like jellyroll fold domain-containing protein [Patescibacteria group bacterium]